jgi:hypothetical protein
MQAEGGSRVDYKDPWAVRPLPIYPVVCGAQDEVLEEVHDFLLHRGLVCALVDGKTSPPYDLVKLLGQLDGFLLEVLQLLAGAGPATAQDLKELSTEKITVGGWSNRLVALLANRLVVRNKEGKTWKYQAIGKEFRPWD